MRIGLNLTFLVPGQVGGSEPFLVNLLRAMIPSGHDFVVYTVTGFLSAYPDLSPSAEIVEMPWSHGAQTVRIATENSWLLIDARRRKLDVMHHGGGTSPFFRANHTVTSIHDIQFTHYPENFSIMKRIWLRSSVAWTCKKPGIITVPSEWVRNDLLSKFELDPTRIATVPFGSQNLFETPSNAAGKMPKKYGIEGPYFLYPSRAYPHKNHLFLLEAFSRVSSGTLVLTGAPWHRDGEIKARAHRLGIADRVRFLGLVSRHDLAGLYSGAHALVYPSCFEGFGAPILEAMSRGTPVIASNVTAIPEVLGNAGILVAADDLTAWSAAIQEVLEDEALRNRLSEQGLNRAKLFDWRRSAELQLDAYRKAANA